MIMQEVTRPLTLTIYCISSHMKFSVLLSLLPLTTAQQGTANYHDFKLQFETIVTDPASIGDDGIKSCTPDGSTYASSCPADRDCCEAQYSPSGFGCTNDQGGCCLMGPALSPSLLQVSMGRGAERTRTRTRTGGNARANNALLANTLYSLS